MSRVIIVGGGILGLFAANEAVRRGFDVVLLEASPDIGGLSRNVAIGGISVDIGVRGLTNTLPEVSRRIIAAAGGRHRYLPWAFTSRYRGKTDRPPLAYTQHLPLLDRFCSMAERLVPHANDNCTIEERARFNLTSPVWKKMLGPLYEKVFGENAGNLAVVNAHAIGLFIPAKFGYWRGVYRGCLDLIRPMLQQAGAVHTNAELDPVDQWPAPQRDPADVGERYGLYPSQGPFSAFTGALAASVMNARSCEIRTNARVGDFEISGGRLRSVTVNNDILRADTFIFSAGQDQVFTHLGITAPRLDYRALAQVNLLARAPLPRRLWEVNYDGGPVARVFFPQRFQGLNESEANVFCCETYWDQNRARDIRQSPDALTNRVIDELVSMQLLHNRSCVLEARVEVIPAAVPVFPFSYFEQLRAAVASAQETASNLHFTGMAATFAPISPATAALEHLIGVFDRFEAQSSL